jgi:hypothetical protein
MLYKVTSRYNAKFLAGYYGELNAYLELVYSLPRADFVLVIANPAEKKQKKGN